MRGEAIGEDIVTFMKRTWNNAILGAAMILLGLVGIVISPAPAAAASMVEYTAYPVFVSRTVPTGILFTVGLSGVMLPADFGNDPLSCPSSDEVGSTYAGNDKGSGVTTLNWSAIRKIDQAKRILISGRTLAASNHNGTAKVSQGRLEASQYGHISTCIGWWYSVVPARAARTKVEFRRGR